MNSLKLKRNGFSLIEVLVSIVIIGLIAVSLLGLFSMGFTNIFSTGYKDSAMAKASSLMDLLYNEQDKNGGLTKEEIETFLNENISGDDIYFDAPIPSELLEDISGHKVTITAIYQGGEKEVSLTSFIRGRENND